MSEKRCFYEVLGCSREASTDDIRRAYKREALRHHPDRHGGDPKAEAAFKEVNEAYQILSDDQKRRVYDQFGHAGLEGGAGFGGGGAGMGDVFAHMQDLFSEMFSGGFGQSRSRRGGDLRVQERLTFKEAAFGTKREVSVHAPARCDDCGGNGAKPGTRPEPCPQCGGSGQISSARGFVMFTKTCGRCRGQGVFIKNACKTCQGQGAVEKLRKVTVTFPAGIDGGQRLRVPGQGMPAPIANGAAGDLYVDVEVEDDPRFERDGADVVTRVHVSFTDAALGAKIDVPSIELDDRTLSLDVPQGTQPGAVFTLAGQGVPRLGAHGRGALVVLVQVDVPKQLSSRAKELLAELDAELKGAVPSAAQSGETRKRAAAAK